MNIRQTVEIKVAIEVFGKQTELIVTFCNTIVIFVFPKNIDSYSIKKLFTASLFIGTKCQSGPGLFAFT